MKKFFVILVALISFGFSAHAQYSDPKVMQQKQNEAKSQPTTTTTTKVSQTECTTKGAQVLGNGASTKTCTSTNNGVKTTTTTTCSSSGVKANAGVVSGEATKTKCTTVEKTETPATKPK